MSFEISFSFVIVVSLRLRSLRRLVQFFGDMAVVVRAHCNPPIRRLQFTNISSVTGAFFSLSHSQIVAGGNTDEILG